MAKDTPSNSGLMTTAEVADLFRVCEQTIRRMHAKGELVGLRLGNSPRAPLKFKREDVDAYLVKQKGR